MEIYKNLHESLQTHVHKMYMTHNIITKIKDVPKPDLCQNCVIYGFPCLNCAYTVFNGKLGPGYSCGKRRMFSNEMFIEDEESHFNMLLHMLTSGYYKYRNKADVFHQKQLPRNYLF